MRIWADPDRPKRGFDAPIDGVLLLCLTGSICGGGPACWRMLLGHWMHGKSLYWGTGVLIGLILTLCGLARFSYLVRRDGWIPINVVPLLLWLGLSVWMAVSG